jgi:hypothetical protein
VAAPDTGTVTSGPVNVASTTLTMPAGAAVGDIAILHVVRNLNEVAPTLGVSSGASWTLIATDTTTSQTQSTWWRKVASGEPGSLVTTITLPISPTAGKFAARIRTIAGLAASPIGATAVTLVPSSNASTTRTSPTITTTAANSIILELFGEKTTSVDSLTSSPAATGNILTDFNATTSSQSMFSGEDTGTYASGVTAGGRNWVTAQAQQGTYRTLELLLAVTGGAAALSGSGTLTAAGTPVVPGTATLTGSGSLAATGTPTAPGTAALSGSGSLSATGAPGFTGAATLSGSGTLSASGAVLSGGQASLSGSGTLSAAGTPAAPGAAALSGAGTLTTTGTPATTGAAALTGSGTLTAAGPLQFSGTATLSGTGTLTASGVVGAAVQQLWVGGQTATTLVAVSKSTPATSCRLGYSTSPTMASPSFVAAQTPDGAGRMRHVVTGLSANTVYYVRLYDTPSGGTEMPIGLIGTTRTLQTAGTAVATRKVVLGGCYDTLATDDSALLDAMSWGADWGHFNGDMFYTGSTSTVDTVQAAQWDTQIAGAASLEKLVRTGLASFYNTSDHEAGPDNGDSNNAYTQSNINGYKKVVPYGTLLDPSGTTGSRDQQWDDGRVSYFMIDCRSVNRSPGGNTDNSSKTMLGSAQKARLKAWLTGNTAPFKVIISDVAWMGPNDIVAKPDAWWSYDTERQELISYITANTATIGHLELWHGDSHLIGYATPAKNTWGGFPILCVAPYNQTGGGRDTSTFSYYFNNGSTAARQYVRVTFTDDGSTITRTAAGWDAVSATQKFSDVVTVNTNTFLGTAALSGSGTLAATAASGQTGAAALSGSGTLAATGIPREVGAAALSGSGSLSTVGAPATAGTAALSGTGSLAAIGAPGFTTTASFTGSGTLTAAGIAGLVTGNANLTGTGTLAGGGKPATATTASLSGTGTLTVNVGASIAGVASFTGTGALAATAATGYVGSAALSGTGVLAVVSSSGYRDIILTTTLDADRWTTTLEVDRWTAYLEDDMPRTIAASLGAHGYVSVLVTETTGKDISGVTFQMALKRNGQVLSGTWSPPSVNTAVTTSQRRLKVLVGAGQTLNPAAGRYRAAVQATDNPELDIIVASNDSVIIG